VNTDVAQILVVQSFHKNCGSVTEVEGSLLGWIVNHNDVNVVKQSSGATSDV
jgi:hypothetical protein